MKIENLNIKIGRNINLGNNEFRSLEISMGIEISQNEEVEQQYQFLKSSLERQLDSWENETRIQLAGTVFDELNEQPPLITAEFMNTQTETSKPSSFRNKYSKSNEMTISGGSYTCPECKEPMKQKEGKDYYLCEKHWGYPNQITKGIVKERKF